MTKSHDSRPGNHFLQVETADIVELSNACRRTQIARQPNGLPCFYLFERALRLEDDAAWQAVMNEFSHMLKIWVYNYSRFQETGEGVDLFVNDAFVRLWRSGTKAAQAGEFTKLSDYLAYLKRCVWASIEDHLRKIRQDSLWQSVSLHNTIEAQTPLPARAAERAMITQQINLLLCKTTQDDPHQVLIAEESWVYGLTPRAIHAKYPDKFSSVSEVSQIKRNILRRLQRHPELQQLAEFLLP